MGVRRKLPKEIEVRTSFAKQPAPTVDWYDIAPVTFDILPEVALPGLEIFDFCVNGTWMESWQNLVHVCRKWRNVVFGSPHRLNLRLRCKPRIPVRDILDVWPPLPIVTWFGRFEKWPGRVDNITAALEQHHRVCEIEFLSYFGKWKREHE